MSIGTHIIHDLHIHVHVAQKKYNRNTSFSWMVRQPFHLRCFCNLFSKFQHRSTPAVRPTKSKNMFKNVLAYICGCIYGLHHQSSIIHVKLRWNA